MKIKSILKKLQGKAGQNLSVKISRGLKTLKNVDAIVEKVTTCKVRTGIDYDNQMIVKMRREIGERPEKNQGLPWGSWAAFPNHVTHNGNDYVRIYPASDRFAENPAKIVEEYFIDGVKATEKQVKEICRASEFSDKSKRDCITVKAENITEIK